MSGLAARLGRLLSGRPAPLKLHVVGVIRSRATATPRTRLGPRPAPAESVFDLAVEEAWLDDGRRRSAQAIDEAVFAGDLALAERFSEGQRVHIVCTTATGRLIESMEPAEP